MKSLRQLANELVIARRTLLSHLKRLGIKTTQQPKPNGGFIAMLSDEQIEQLKEWLKDRRK